MPSSLGTLTECVNFLFRLVAIFNIKSQWQGPEILIFVIRVYYEKLGHTLKPIVPKFRPHLSSRLKDIAKKTHATEKLKTIADPSSGRFLRYTQLHTDASSFGLPTFRHSLLSGRSKVDTKPIFYGDLKHETRINYYHLTSYPVEKWVNNSTKLTNKLQCPVSPCAIA